MAKLTAYEIYKKAQKENLTHDQYKQLLLDNGIIIKKVSEGKTDNTEQSALPIFNVSVAKRKVCPQCKREFDHTEVPSGIFCCYACEYGY
jgi:hypothetical protein